MYRVFIRPLIIALIMLVIACRNNSDLHDPSDQALSVPAALEGKVDSAGLQSIIDLAGEKMIILHEAIQAGYSDFQFWYSQDEPGKVDLFSKFYVTPSQFFKTDSLMTWGEDYALVISDFIFNDISNYMDSVYVAFITDKGVNNGKSMFVRGYRGSQLNFQMDFDGKDAIRARLTLFGTLIRKTYSIAFDGTMPDLKLHIMMPAEMHWYKNKQLLNGSARRFARLVFLYILQDTRKDYSEIILHFQHPNLKDEMIYAFQTSDTLFSNIFRRPRYGTNPFPKDTIFFRE